MNKLLAMQVFVRVVETGGITRAADSLQMPKATVTTLIQQLENDTQNGAAVACLSGEFPR